MKLAVDRDTADLVNRMVTYWPDDRRIAQYAGCDLAYVQGRRRAHERKHTGRMSHGRALKPTSRESLGCECIGADQFTRGAVRGSQRLLAALQRAGAA